MLKKQYQRIAPLPYFKEQLISWLEKVEKFRQDKQLYDNFSDIFIKFSKLVEELEGELYNEKQE